MVAKWTGIDRRVSYIDRHFYRRWELGVDQKAEKSVLGKQKARKIGSIKKRKGKERKKKPKVKKPYFKS